MKRITGLFLMVLMVFGMVGCDGTSAQNGAEGETLSIQQEEAFSQDEGAFVFEKPQIGDVLVENDYVKVCYNGLNIEYRESMQLQFVTVKMTVEPKQLFAFISFYGAVELNNFVGIDGCGEYFCESFNQGETYDIRMQLNFPYNFNSDDISVIKRIGFSYESYVNNFPNCIFDDTAKDASGKIVIYPNGKQKIESAITLNNEKSKTVYDNGGVRLIIANWKYDQKQNGDKVECYLYVINNTDKKLEFDIKHSIVENTEEWQYARHGYSEDDIPRNGVNARILSVDKLKYANDIRPSQLTLKITGEIFEGDNAKNGVVFEASEYVIDLTQIEE